MAKYLSPGIYVKEVETGAKPIEGVSTSTAGFLGVAEKGTDSGTPKLLTSFLEYQREFGGYLPKSTFGTLRFLPHAVNNFFINGGKRCYVLRIAQPDNLYHSLSVDDFTGTSQGKDGKRGLKAFEDIPDVSVMAIPGITNENVPGAQNALVTHCQQMKNRFAVLDLPEGIEQTAEIARYRETINSSYAAVYHPWIKVFDPLVHQEVFIPPSGSVIGVYARTDNDRGVFKAPANVPLLNATDLKFTIDRGEQDILNSRGINCIKAFIARGIMVWGAKTCSEDPLWKYINVRRFLIYLEESIKKGTRWAIFEPNNEKLWARIKQTTTEFLTHQWKKGALMGNTPEQAFFAICDRTTMSQNDINQGRLIILLGVALMKPAEFTVFRIIQSKEGPAAIE